MQILTTIGKLFFKAANLWAGRTGRTGPGTCYHLFTEDSYKEKMVQQPVQKSSLENVLLLLKSSKIDSMYQLWISGALNNTGNLTDIGLKMSQFPLDPHLAKMLLMGEEFNCVNEVLAIVSMHSVLSVFFSPKDRAEESDAAHARLFVPESDHLILLEIYKQWKANKYN